MTQPFDDDRELDTLFAHARSATRAPAGLAARVQAQVALAPRAAHPLPALAPAHAFWLRAAAHPAVVLAFLVAGCAAMEPSALAGGGTALALRAAAALTGAWAWGVQAALARAPGLRDPLVEVALIACAAVPLAWLARETARGAERLTVRLAGPAV